MKRCDKYVPQLVESSSANQKMLFLGSHCISLQYLKRLCHPVFRVDGLQLPNKWHTFLRKKTQELNRRLGNSRLSRSTMLKMRRRSQQSALSQRRLERGTQLMWCHFDRALEDAVVGEVVMKTTMIKTQRYGPRRYAKSQTEHVLTRHIWKIKLKTVWSCSLFQLDELLVMESVAEKFTDGVHTENLLQSGQQRIFPKSWVSNLS